jgi:hypothetical protein
MQILERMAGMILEAHDGAPQLPFDAKYVVVPVLTVKLTLFKARVALSGMETAKLGT